MSRLTKEQILNALQALSDEVRDRGRTYELVIVGGAALVLLYNARETTRDIDAIRADAELLEGSRRVAAEFDLPPDWLNDGAKGYAHGITAGKILFSTENLIVRTVAAQQLLAMKLSAWRDDVDIEDAKLLLSKLEGDRQHIWTLVEPHLVPGRELKARYAFDDLWEVLYGNS